jgi:hypothetical protein
MAARRSLEELSRRGRHWGRMQWMPCWGVGR